MRITWDEPKRQLNLAKHGFDFVDLADGSFFETAVITPSVQGRFKAIGILRDGTIAVIFARLGTQGIAVISMRPANRKERSLLP
ncbi:BrnT family toxin [Zavarzinia aquatilis]|uniref:BrnT family toxin n=1 Tax=Zavarzinia aquatilis TaxID=2211142 RepID=A0A317E7B9_9PROT|nr:BrnT family toxin [Zavarzinia aquatilis]PWR22521.1 hypothetical protein DKG74_11640 [Zavarzinia aquatilis]